jgi:molybdenum cofactor biosynthesis protein MoaC
MIDITHKITTLRTAVAGAIVRVSDPKTIELIQTNAIPKGNVFEMAKTAGLFAVKKTADLIPDCHPLPIEYTSVSYSVSGLEIHIEMCVKTIYRTGVEVEAMHGASVVALTMYDMLKPVDKGISIEQIRLISKTGGKSEKKNSNYAGLKAAVIVCSDSISNGIGEDKAGRVISEKLISLGVEVSDYLIIPDEQQAIKTTLLAHTDRDTDLLIFTGGTGLSKRDITPDTIKPLLDIEIPGIMEASRAYGQERTPFAMLSRGIAGVKGNTLILTLPGSTKGAEESMDALFPSVLHLFGILKGKRHE